ncbi:hypothetical protein [Endozoicomonas elysicola]|uniref:Uncharacterized protein n=1 Tax=Endozoicomonas elysicola TaxID=305900 RepID=A0A081KCP6_9GAMM|nr:hypothetical protein [Endozoicomonas elysicola]KEI71922.1 hypothetical protein GV64_15325 [Endozoicomonas elysicola]
MYILKECDDVMIDRCVATNIISTVQTDSGGGEKELLPRVNPADKINRNGCNQGDFKTSGSEKKSLSEFDVSPLGEVVQEIRELPIIEEFRVNKSRLSDVFLLETLHRQKKDCAADHEADPSRVVSESAFDNPKVMRERVLNDEQITVGRYKGGIITWVDVMDMGGTLNFQSFRCRGYSRDYKDELYHEVHGSIREIYNYPASCEQIEDLKKFFEKKHTLIRVNIYTKEGSKYNRSPRIPAAYAAEGEHKITHVVLIHGSPKKYIDSTEVGADAKREQQKALMNRVIRCCGFLGAGLIDGKTFYPSLSEQEFLKIGKKDKGLYFLCRESWCDFVTKKNDDYQRHKKEHINTD